MSEENKSAVEGEDAGNEDVDQGGLQAELDRLRGELAKERNLKKNIIKERDELKKSAPKAQEDSENYKELYQRQIDENKQLKDRVKNKEIDSAVRTQLQKIGILPDAMEVALKSIDSSMIHYDEEDGTVDSFSVESAAKALKTKAKFMFEAKIEATKNRSADSGKNTEAKEMTRAEFEKLPMGDRREAALKYKIID